MLSFYQRYALLPFFFFGVAKKRRPDAGWTGRNLIGGGQENYFFLEDIFLINNFIPQKKNRNYTSSNNVHVENGYPVVYACYCAEKCVENFSF